MKLLLLLLSACSALVVLASPHNIRVARHHAVAVRAPVAIPDDTPLQRRQSSRRRCRTRSSSAGNPSSTPAVNPSPVRLYPSPSTTTTPHVNKPVPTTTTPTTTPTPQPTTTQSNSNLPSFMNGVQTGQGTYFDVALGACGWTNQGSEYVVAVSHVLFDGYPGYSGVNPNTNPVCGKKIKATYQGKSVTVTVVDRCAADTCLVGNLDFSRAAFGQLADFDVGRISHMNWEWVS